MTSSDVLVVITGLFFGYWIVSAIINRSSPNSDHRRSHEESHSYKKKKAEHDSIQKNEYEDDVSKGWFIVLNVPENATKKEIESAYRDMMHQYHPDKVAHLGQDLRELADHKTRKIIEAYNYAKSIRS